MTQQQLELPKGWVETEFKKTVKSIPLTGKKLKQKEYLQSGKFPVIDQGQDFIGGFTDKKELVVECKLPIIVFGDHTKAVKFVNQNFVAGADGVKVLEPNSIFNPKLLYYFIQAMPLPNKGYARHYQHLEKLMIKIPPSNEQKRIVLKMEELFSKIDSTKQSLEYSKLQLVQYRESLLKSAFEGKLTEKWREQNKPSLEVLLEKIQSNRKNQNTKLQKLKPFSDETSFTIPLEWNWTRIGIISNEIQYGTSDKASTKESKLPVLRMGNIQDGVLNFDKLKYYPDNWKHKEQYLLKDGDVLFNRTNSAELVGKTAIYRHFHPTAVFAGYLIRVKILDEIYAPFLLTWYLNSIFGKSFVQSVVSQQVGQANVNGTKLAMMPIPLMSIEEQEQIVSQIEQGFSLIENSQRIVNSTLQTLEMMRMSVLKQAFEGKLVPQDPNDEPASILLEKIKNAQVAQKPKQRRAKNVK